MKNERILKLVGVLKYVEISEFREFFKVNKFEFSVYGQGHIILPSSGRYFRAT